METRAAVAYFGTFGYELNLNLLSGEEQRQVSMRIHFILSATEIMTIMATN